MKLLIATLFLLIASQARAGIWGIPRAYAVERFTSDDQKFVRLFIERVAYEHDLADRLALAQDHSTFAYYFGDAGTLQAREIGGRGVIDLIFLAKERAAAEAIDRVICYAFARRLGERFESVPRKVKRPNQSPEPTPTAVTVPADAGLAPAAVVAHL